jgi:Fanconi anemia group M protein
MDNLFLEKIEFRRLTDSDVQEFTQETDLVWDHVILPEKIQQIVTYLNNAYLDKLEQVRKFGFLSHAPSSYTKISLLTLQQKLHATLQQEHGSIELLQSISLLAQALKILHALELAQTQTIHALHEYLYGLLASSRTTKTKAVKNLVIDPNFLSALSIARDLIKEGIEHPKLDLLKSRVFNLLERKPDAKIIIFSQFRDSATKIQEWISPISSSLFFGQAKKNGVGFSQKKQKEVLDDFKSGKFTCLIATSVAEEGLDIPSVDQVFFFEPVPSAIRSVQRRGRTGRHTKGFVTVLVTKGTRDESNRWVSFHKEKRMFSVLDSFEKSPSTKTPSPQKSLSIFANEIKDSDNKKLTIVVDHREKGSPVIKALRSLDVSIELKQLQVGDFVISKDACVEYKQYSDLLDSIVDGRLLVQLRSLSQYKKPILLLEGDATPSNLRRVDKSAIQGMITTIALSYRIPIIRTYSSLESAQFLQIMARREQLDEQQEFTYHTSKPLTDKELLEYVVSSLPNIGGSLAKALLESFDNLQDLLAASVDDLKQIPLIGEKKAQDLKRLFSLSYKSTKDNSSR